VKIILFVYLFFISATDVLVSCMNVLQRFYFSKRTLDWLQIISQSKFGYITYL